jgi:hypothetical protein
MAMGESGGLQSPNALEEERLDPELDYQCRVNFIRGAGPDGVSGNENDLLEEAEYQVR